MDKTRKIKKVLIGQPTLEGAGVHLRRGFGFREVPMFDPFLMFDDFRQDDPDKYLPGIPLAPPPRHRDDHLHDPRQRRARRQHGQQRRHRPGRRPVDDGRQRHHPPGDAQGRGRRPDGRLPALGQPARLAEDDGPALPRREESGHPRGRAPRRGHGPRHLRHGRRRRAARSGTSSSTPSTSTSPCRRGTEFVHPTKPGHTVFAYVFEGQGCFSDEPGLSAYDVEPASYFDLERTPFQGDHSIILFGDGSRVRVATTGSPVRFLLFSGRPLGEPVAWQGPIVMNTQEELRTAFREYRAGTFIKHPKTA